MQMHPEGYRARLLIGLLAVIGLIATACGGTAAPSSSPVASVAASGSPSGNIVLPKPEKTDIVLGFSAISSPSTGDLVRASNPFKKYGLNVTFQVFNGAAAAMQALLAGQVDVSDNSEGPVLATVPTSSPTQYVMITRANDSDILYSQASIKTAADLKGKTIAVSSFGSNSYAGAIYALKALGLTDKDVTITAVGNDTQRLAALKSGAVSASIQDNTREKELNGLGYNSLVRLADIKPAFGQPGASLVAPVDFIKKYPNTTLAIVAGYMEANWMMQTAKPADLVPYMKQTYDKMTDAELIDAITLAQQEPWTPKDGQCRAEDVQFGWQIAQVANPALKDIDPLKICNNDFVNKLKDLGLQKKLGIPGY